MTVPSISVILKSRFTIRYIHFVKGYFRPVLTKEAEKVISSYYQLQRRSATQNAGFVYKTIEITLCHCQFLSHYCFIHSKDNCSHAGKPDTPCSRYGAWCNHGFPISCFHPQTCQCDVAHARLMFRNEVTRLDAITAILCIESSMTTSAIVDSVGNALHSNFMDNPDQECILHIFLRIIYVYQ